MLLRVRACNRVGVMLLFCLGELGLSFVRVRKRVGMPGELGGLESSGLAFSSLERFLIRFEQRLICWRRTFCFWFESGEIDLGVVLLWLL